MLHRFVAALSCVAVLIHVNVVGAQPVNAEVLRPNDGEPGWSAGADGDFALSRGNVELFNVGGAARGAYQTFHPVPLGQLDGSEPPRFVAQRVFLTTNVRFAEEEGSPFINQGFAHLRWTAMWLPRIGNEVFAQHSFNEFFRLQARSIVGAGVRVAIVQLTEFRLWGGSGVMAEYERIEVQPGAADDNETFGPRATNYLSARIALWDEAFLLQNTFYYQPKLAPFEDYRVLEELEAMAKVTDVFSLGATLSVLRDNRPPTGVEKTDLRLGNTVRLSF